MTTFSRISKASEYQKPTSSPILLLVSISAVAIGLFWFFYSSPISSSSSFPLSKVDSSKDGESGLENKYLYWGNRIDCPGKHCDSCEGLGHQESSLRCALEEALFLNRVFVMPSRMCINPIHNKKGILHESSNGNSEERWGASSCAMESLYDVDLLSKTIPVILDNSKMWHRIRATSMKLRERGIAHVEGTSRNDLKDYGLYSNVLLINRTASPLSWFMECKDRTNHSSVMLPYSFLPTMAARKLRDAADKGNNHCAGLLRPFWFWGVTPIQIKGLLGDYDAIHVRRGDKIKTRKDRHGVDRIRHPHLDRDTRPEFIQSRITKWIPPGRTLFIASNERTQGFFSPLSTRYKLAYASNYSSILDPVIENNYQLFMIERLILSGAKTFVKTLKEEENDLYLCDDPKKSNGEWHIPVYTMDEEGSRSSQS